MAKKGNIEAKKCKTPEFRVSYPHVFEPQAIKEGQEKKYSVVMLFDKSTDLSALKKAVHNAKIEKWGKDKEDWPKRIRSPFRLGDEDRPDTEGYKGKIFVTATSRKKPQVVGGQKDDEGMFPRLTDESEFYAGCYARATLIAFAYGGEDGVKEGVAFALQAVQKTKNGKKFGGGRPAEQEFDEIEDDSDDADNYEDDEDSSDGSDDDEDIF